MPRRTVGQSDGRTVGGLSPAVRQSDRPTLGSHRFSRPWPRPPRASPTSRACSPAVVERGLRQWVWEDTPAPDLLAQQMDEMAEGRRSPYDVAADILEQLRSGAIR